MMTQKNLTILAVDDDLINLKLIKSMLLKTGCVKEVIEVKNGASAIEQLRNRDDIDLLLLDIIMPVMNGIEVLKVMQADDTLTHIPTIILTTDETKKAQALELGAKGFLVKPIRHEELLATIVSVL